MSNYGIVNTIEPPMLSGTSQAQLIEFEIRYSAYSERITFINNGRPTNQKVKPATIRQCMKPKLLHSLCILGRIPDTSKSEEATDASVSEWFNSRLNSNSKSLSDRVQDSIQSVQYKLDNEEPENTSEPYVLNVITALDERNASEVISDSDQCKEFTKKLIFKLQPPELHQRMLDSIQMWTSSQKSDLGFSRKRLVSTRFKSLLEKKPVIISSAKRWPGPKPWSPVIPRMTIKLAETLRLKAIFDVTMEPQTIAMKNSQRKESNMTNGTSHVSTRSVPSFTVFVIVKSHPPTKRRN